MLRTQPVFSSYWVTRPPKPVGDEIKTCDLPSIVNSLLEVKDGDSLGHFLQNVNTRKTLQKEIDKLLSELEHQLQKLWKPEDKEILKIKEQLQYLKEKFAYEGSNATTNESLLAPYREGIPLFFNILNIIKKEPRPISDDLVKITMISLFEQMDACFNGMHTRACYAWLQLSAPPEHELSNMRQEIAKEEAVLRIKKLPLMEEEPEMWGNQIHFINSILNYFAESFGLLAIHDSHAFDLSQPCPDSRDPSWYDALKQITLEMTPLLTPRLVFEKLAEKIASEIRTFKNNSERDVKINALLNQHGSDEDFHIGYHIITDTGELQSEWELLQNIRMTLLKRYEHQGHVKLDIERIQPLTPTITLHQCEDENFNYVLKPAILGAPSWKMPLSNYLLKVAAGYEVSLFTRDDTEELEQDLQTVISPPALIKSKDTIQIYGMVDDKPTLTELKLNPNLIEWKEGSSLLLPDECYQMIATHKAHNEPSPLDLLKEVNKLLLLHDKTVLALWTTPQALSLLPEAGWSNVTALILQDPFIDVPHQKQWFFGTDVLQSSEMSFFHAAALYGQEKVVGELLKFAKETYPDGTWQEETLFKRAKDQTPLLAAAEHGRSAVVEQLLEALSNLKERSDYIKQTDAKGLTPLHLAANKGHSEVVKQLLAVFTDREERSDYIKQKNIFGATPLYIAAHNGHSDVIQALLTELEDPKERSAYIKQTFNGATPLFIAARQGHSVVIKQLLAGLADRTERSAYIKQTNALGATPLYCAAANGHFDVIVQLLAVFADPKERVDYIQQTFNGATPLYIAAHNGHSDVIQALLTELEDPKERSAYIKQTFNGATPLFIAARQGHSVVIKQLLAGLADRTEQSAYIQQKYNGTTPLHIAAQNGHSAIVEQLLEGLWPYARSHYIEQTSNGKTALFLAAKEGHLEIVKMLISYTVKWHILIEPFITMPGDLIRFAQENNVSSEMKEYLENPSRDGITCIKISPNDIANIMGHKKIVDYLSYQIALSTTPVYEYAQRLNVHLLTAQDNGWKDLAVILDKYKKNIIDPEMKIDQVMIEQKNEILSLIETLEKTSAPQPLLASPSAFYGASNPHNKAIKMRYLVEIEKMIEEFQHKIAGNSRGFERE